MKHAFSLVELSIVLVILGLLTGSILVANPSSLLLNCALLGAATAAYKLNSTSAGCALFVQNAFN